MKNFKMKKFMNIYLTLAFLIVILVLKIVYDTHSDNHYAWLKVNSIIGWIALVWSIVSWKNMKNEIFSFYTVFLISFYLFTFGQSLLIILNAVDKSRDLLFRFNVSELVYAQFFTLLSLVSFHLGALIICRKSNQNTDKPGSNMSNKNKANSINNKIMINAIKYTGLILFICSLPGFLYQTFYTLKTVSQGGYGALYGYHTGGVQSRGTIIRIFELTSNYFAPSIICLVIAYRSNKKIRRLIFAILTMPAINLLYVGKRSEAIVLILTIILIHHYSIVPIKKIKAIQLGIFSYFLVSFLSIVASLRGLSNKSFINYFVAFVESFGKKSLFFETISELGWTMFPLGTVMNIIPKDYNYLYGKSYIYSLTAIVPNIGFWEIHPAKLYAGGAQWLMDTLNLWSGPGFTLIADAYRNFGWYGFTILFVFGLLFGKVYSSVDKFTINIRPHIICIVMIFFATTLISVRGDNLYIVRPVLTIVMPIYLLIMIIYNGLYGKSLIKS